VSTDEGTSTALNAELLGWISQTAAGEVLSAVRSPGGGRREAWFVDVRTTSGEVMPLFLRYDRRRPDDTGDPFTLHREAQFFLALQGTGVPVPRVLGVHPMEQAILSTRVSGRTWFSQLRDEGERVAIAREFMTSLAALHALDPHRLGVAGQDPDADLRVLVSREIDTWEELYRHGGATADPMIELGFAWLRRNVPDVSAPVVIVQGDTGPGNFLYENGHVTAVLDWELAHLGDPHDDLGWLCLRATQEPFTDLRERFADYAAATGREIDLTRVIYYRVFAELRVVVLAYQREQQTNLLGEVGNGVIYGALHRRLFVEALAAAMDVHLIPPPLLAAEPSERAWLFDAALAQIREVIVPRSEDPFVVVRSKGLARVLKYLKEADRFAVAADKQELDDVDVLLGERPASRAEAREALAKALEAGAISEAEALQFFGRSMARETQQLRPAMGALADRHFDPLTDEPVRR
jgi:aminoglycoside phosphotransferase (APT) family kinase protein